MNRNHAIARSLVRLAKSLVGMSLQVEADQPYRKNDSGDYVPIKWGIEDEFGNQIPNKFTGVINYQTTSCEVKDAVFMLNPLTVAAVDVMMTEGTIAKGFICGKLDNGVTVTGANTVVQGHMDGVTFICGTWKGKGYSAVNCTFDGLGVTIDGGILENCVLGGQEILRPGTTVRQTCRIGGSNPPGDFTTQASQGDMTAEDAMKNSQQSQSSTSTSSQQPQVSNGVITVQPADMQGVGGVLVLVNKAIARKITLGFYYKKQSGVVEYMEFLPQNIDINGAKGPMVNGMKMKPTNSGRPEHRKLFVDSIMPVV